ncbi:MAG: UDP-N-acetylmuramoyl-tripeptide--D-alanyl-D-alanine ligase [Candidatus Reconcilbacillus cellulovorans]|uniref:UDP-N-acetylmuramoyl-tripeptide--D-alanyl-D-alanine ligase n=1 Tax=Candidatus Reconcilbacillus cellulovorans TaxID=1906605 RepID=A0A2A6E347_9BACL|nr:MAG: UDP-N-acetylmuramoyl-tripeptide--D-alanyl-D-alanine ligase [Candidatus Reconcilbacillus cellulovorans]
MIRRTLRQIAEMSGGRLAEEANADTPVAGVSIDSRTIAPGNLFIPFVGTSHDGHSFVPEAIRKGAAAFCWQTDHGEPPDGAPAVLIDDAQTALMRLAAAYRRELQIRVVGVTGSNGKTTTKDMIAAVLGTTYRVQKTRENQNSHIGLPLSVLALEETTEVAVLEMGMRARGEIAELSKIARPDVAVITCIGEAHLERLGSREAIARAKLEILEGLREDGLFVYPGDEPLIRRLLAEAPRPSGMVSIRFGESADGSCDLFPIALMQETAGTHFVGNWAGSPHFYVPLPGRHHVRNALAALAVGKWLGVSDADAARGLRHAELTGMRTTLVRGASGLTILDDAYNANPTSMHAALDLLAELRGFSRKFVVFGDMLELGPEEERYHREIGRRFSPDVVQGVFTVGELAALAAEEAKRRYPDQLVRAYYDCAKLIDDLLAVVDPGDVVLVKGSRAMRLEQVVEVLRRWPGRD